ncbi:MAG: DUF3341 domain-containing protein [Planctomycetes bacterium]|nr:DUF3341 domain-containing protein [Planctomycetota bacterium]
MPTKVIYGLYAEEAALLAATRAARDGGGAIRDVHTPYAVHGLDEAMGLRPTRLGIVCFVLGVTGALFAFGFQSWVFLVDWPLNVGGKSFWAPPALLPVTFEVGVLFAALGTVLAFLLRSGLVPGAAPALALPEVTDDRFALVLDAPDAAAAERARALLLAHHALEIREVEVAA